MATVWVNDTAVSTAYEGAGTVTTVWEAQHLAVVAGHVQLQSPNGTYWQVVMQTNGTVQISDDSPATTFVPQLQSPNGTIWQPSISNAGVLSWSDDGTTPVRLLLADPAGVVWEWTISNAGVITITSTSGAAHWLAPNRPSTTWIGQGAVT